MTWNEERLLNWFAKEKQYSWEIFDYLCDFNRKFVQSINIKIDMMKSDWGRKLFNKIVS